MWLSCVNGREQSVFFLCSCWLQADCCVSIAPLAILSVLRNFVFLRGPGAAQLDLLEKLMMYLMARSSMEETKNSSCVELEMATTCRSRPALELIRAERSSNGSWRSHKRSNRQLHPRCRRVTSGSAGYDCVNNATLPLCDAQKPWGGRPRVAGPLATSLWTKRRGGDPKTDQVTQGLTQNSGAGNPKRKRPNCHRKEELSKQRG